MHAQYQVHAPFWRVAPMLAAARYSAPATLQLPSSAVTRAVPYHAVCAEWQSYIAFVRPTAGRAVHPVSQQSASHLSTQSASQPATFPPRRPVSHSPIEPIGQPAVRTAHHASQPAPRRPGSHSLVQPATSPPIHPFTPTNSPPPIRLSGPSIYPVGPIDRPIRRYTDAETQIRYKRRYVCWSVVTC